MNNETGQRLTEAIWALTNELRKAEQGPPHTGAAPVTSGEFRVGDWVRVVGPDRDPLLGKVGRVRNTQGDVAFLDFPGMQSARFNYTYLAPALKPTTPTPRH